MAPMGTREISRYVLVVILAGSAGTAGGWNWHKSWASSNRHHYVDVSINARADSTHFILEPVGMQPWPAVSCTPLDWQAGERLKWIDYQQRESCKDFKDNGSYVCYFDDNGRCINFRKEIASNGGD